MPRGSKVSLERGELALRFVNLMHEVDQPRISPPQLIVLLHQKRNATQELL
jgi:hypothetical protein